MEGLEGRDRSSCSKVSGVRIRARMLAVALCLGWTLGCQHDPWAGEFLKKKPSDADLVGHYVIDLDSRERKLKLPTGAAVPVSPNASIGLSSDHSAEFVDVTTDENGTVARLVTGKGTWSVSRTGDFYGVTAVIRDDQNPNGFGHELMLYGKKPPYKLHVTLGDPDSGYAVQFEKK